HADMAARLMQASSEPAPSFSQVDPARVTDVGDGDGAVEPGEGFQFVQPVKNTGTGTANAYSVIRDEDPVVTVTQSAASYGPIAAGASADGGPLRGTIAPDAKCGSDVHLDVETTGDPGLSFVPSRTAGPVLMRLGAPQLQPEVASSAIKPFGEGDVM